MQNVADYNISDITGVTLSWTQSGPTVTVIDLNLEW